FFFSSRRRHTRFSRDWSSDVCSSDLLRMIDNRFNALAHWDNPNGDRYSVELEIISVEMNIDAGNEAFPLIEILKTNIVDRKTNEIGRASCRERVKMREIGERDGKREQ